MITQEKDRTKLRYLCLFITILSLLYLAAGSAAASDISVKVVSAPLTKLASSTNGMVRVYLSSLGNPSKLNLTVAGSYSINGNTNQALTNGEALTVNFSSSTGKLTLTRQGTTTDMGSQFALRRHNTSGSNGILISQSNMPSNPYPGDIRFIVDKASSGYKLYTIAYIYIESYLYGVVPYEMGNSAHLEALKAQALAARTYTLKAMQSRTGSIYDVVDTTNDQVYYGTPSGSANCKTAVDATKGIVLMNGTSLTGTYYTASNGGQTEATKNIWGGSGYPYLKVKDDPFDLANPDSRKVTATIYGDAQSGSQNASLKTLLNSKAATAVKNMGYQSSSSVVTVLTINSITPHTPKYPDPSRLYTLMDFNLKVRTKNTAGATVEVGATVTCDIFSSQEGVQGLEGILGLSISSSKNELWTVTKSGSNFILTARRYGHGAGLSQRGAMQMGRLGYTYDEIVGFYFEGCKRVQHNFTNTILSAISSGTPEEETTVEPPADLDDSGSAPASAIVHLVDASGLLGIRDKASTSGAILGTVPHGVPVKVWAVKDDWAFIQYGNISGYVQVSALSITGTAPETTDNTPTKVSEYATVTATNYLNLRSAGNATASVVGTAPTGAVLSVFSKTSQWAYVQYGAIIAYASTDFLKFSAGYPGNTADPSSNGATVTIEGGSGTVNLRASASTSATVLAKLSHGTNVTVLSDDGVWCKVKYQSTTGYILADYLTLTGQPGEVPAEDPPLGDGEVEAVVNPDNGTLNLRKTASQDAEILLEIPKGDSVIVTQRGTTWCAVRYSGISGYVMTQYLKFTDDEEEETPPATQVQYAKVTTTSGSLNMRTQGKAGSAILCTIPRNTTIEVVSKGSTWSRVKYAGYDGFVMNEFLTFLASGQTPAPTATPAPTPTPAPAAAKAKVTTESGSLNMRKSASSGAVVIRTIPQNAIVTVVKKSGDWTQVTYEGKTGFVMTKYLTFLSEATPTPKPSASPSQGAATPTPTPTPTATPTPTPTPKPTSTPASNIAFVNTTSGSLNMRKEGKSTATIILRIPQNAQVTVVSKGSTWSKVSYGGKTGYVMTTYLRFASTATATPKPSASPTPTGTSTAPTPTPTPAPTSGTAWVNTKSGSLNMRKEAKSGSTVLITIPQYSVVTLKEKGSVWCKVTYGGRTGYVLTEYLAFEGTPPNNSSGETQKAWVLTDSGSLNLRAKPASSANKLGTVPRLAQVTVYSKGSTWSQISYSGISGYVMTQYLTFTKPAELATEAPPASAQEQQSEPPAEPVLDPTLVEVEEELIATITPENDTLNLRTECSETATILLEMPKGESLKVLMQGETWCKVLYQDKEGYCMTKYLTFPPEV
jgi:SpoIID/LytB domain protein